jgi:DNA polymerase-3 subunit epsilon
MFWKSWIQRPELENLPEYWQQYSNHFQQNLDKKTPLKDLEYVVFDTETTGLDIYKDKILSIGAVTIEQGEINVANTFECYIKQDFKDTQSIAIHGIMPQNHYATITEQEAVEQFLAYIKGKILIGHHVGFDIAMINQALFPKLNLKLKNYAFDTALLYHRLKYPLHQRFLPHEDYTLDSLSGQFNISVSDRHTAAGDAFITAILFLKLIHQLTKQGVCNLNDLLKT